MATATESRHVPFDPTKFDDDLLVVLAQVGSGSAKEELMARYYPSVRSKIRDLARKMKLPRQEVPDAQEQGMLWFDEAIGRYKTKPQPGQRLYSFRSSVNWLLGVRFINFVKHARWAESHFERSEIGAEALEKATAPLTGSGLSSQLQEGEETSAALALEEDEFHARLEWAVNQLRPEFQDLWESLKAGRKLKWIAKDQGVSVRTIQRWKAELLVELQRLLGEFR